VDSKRSGAPRSGNTSESRSTRTPRRPASPQRRRTPSRAAIRRRVRRAQLNSSSFRLRSSFIAIAFVISIFGARLIQLQGIDASAYAPMAAAEGAQTVDLPAPRGTIVDRFGTPIAQTVEGSMLVADPSMTADQALQIATVLHARLGLDYFDLVDRLRTPDSRFAYLARYLPQGKADSVMAELDAKHLTGVFDYNDPIRSYPDHDVAANMVGFVGTDGTGLSGLEYAYDSQLAGKDGSETFEQGPDGARIPLANSSTVPPQQGTGLQLTIDSDLQWYLQRRLATAVRQTGALSGSAVVMDTQTGQILGLADAPTIDASDPAGGRDANVGSRAIEDIYEPGSVEKVLTFSALIDGGYVTPRTEVTVPPTLSREGHTIHDWWTHGTLHLTTTGVIAQSSNIGTVLSSEQMPSATLYHYLRSFGLGQLTDIGLPGESAGLLPKGTDWQRITHDTIAFGQGLSVNTVQMAAALAAVANGGVRIDPTLIAGTIDANGELTPAPAPQQHRVISARAAHAVGRMMEEVTGPNGTAPAAAIPGYRVAGKTGTAQRAVAGGYHGFTISFGGFAPADKPRFLIYIVIQDPKDGSGGGSAGGPVFHDIMAYALQKYGVAPTGSTAPRLPMTW
jgi:cell division protein FtsI (penicillin-binding protein 3)